MRLSVFLIALQNYSYVTTNCFTQYNHVAQKLAILIKKFSSMFCCFKLITYLYLIQWQTWKTYTEMRVPYVLKKTWQKWAFHKDM
jgi:hypothetical protein